MHLMLQTLGIIAGAFISEDLTLIAVALLIRSGGIPWPIGLLAAFLGIFVGDLYLWALGRIVGRRTLAFAWIARRLPQDRITTAGDWFTKHGLKAMIASRFLPGTRLPMYVASGILGKNAPRVIAWTFLAALIWTPLFVGAIVLFGDTFLAPFHKLFGHGILPLLLLALIPYAAMLLWGKLLKPSSPKSHTDARSGLPFRGTRRQLLTTLRRLAHREFWPAWLFYLPIIPYLLYLAIRHRSLTPFTAANPAIPMGGIIDESKSDILSHLPKEFTLDFALIPPAHSDDPDTRTASLEKIMRDKNWQFPLIFKPDNGYRGAAVKLIRSDAAARDYLTQNPLPTLIQIYHPGPYEAGIFYYRLPHQPTGHILSITDKHFPTLTGDGIHTLEYLITHHPRYSLQADTFLARHAAIRHTILPKNHTLPLALAGNHCQGTLFKDGTHLLTPQLAARINQIAQHYPGFFFGRFDVRYTNPDNFRAGTDLAILELNGVSSESTNIYDPAMPLLQAYKFLFQTWKLAYAIGAANARTGTPITSLPQIRRAFQQHKQTTKPNPLSD